VDGRIVTAGQIHALAGWDPAAPAAVQAWWFRRQPGPHRRTGLHHPRPGRRARSTAHRHRLRCGAWRHPPVRATVRIDTLGEADYYRHGGILPYVLRSLSSR